MRVAAVGILLACTWLAGCSRPIEPGDIISRFSNLWYDQPDTWRTMRWFGIVSHQNPMDVWIIQEIFQEIKPDVMIECGAFHGGSAALWATLLEGTAARASGLDADLRRDHPHDAYDVLRFEVPVEDGGDVRARLMIRAREVEQSLAILQQVLDTLPDTPIVAALPRALPARASALGWVEAWRGPITHWVATDEDGDIARVKVTDPSFLNWPALVHAVPGNIIPDFPVINKSFNLSYSGSDR